MNRIAALERRGDRKAALPRPRGLKVREVKRAGGAQRPDAGRAAPSAEDATNASITAAPPPTAAATLLFLPDLLHVGQPIRFHLLQSL